MKILCVLSRYAYGKPERGENYDYVHFIPALEGLGHEVSFFDSGDRALHSDFAGLNVALVARIAEFRPDVIFCVLMHFEIWLDTLDLVRSQSPALVINWGTDDSWKFRQASRYFAAHVDMHVTTDVSAESAALSLGLSNVFLSQWAASSDTLVEPLCASDCRYDVSFVGSLYGYRSEWISVLKSAEFEVSCFGHGTEHGVVDAADIPQIIRSSRISLNFSGAGHSVTAAHSAANRQIKARTFEVPGAGGFLLTENAPGLDRYFVIEDEIASFDSPTSLIDCVQYFLQNPEERDRIARAGHARTREDHTYEKRFFEILDKLPSVDSKRAAQAWSLSAEDLNGLVKKHRNIGYIRWIRSILLALFVPIFGQRRGPRAARRLVYELCWRIAGDKTFSAHGLPGRLFYAES
jgi:spore maturation protein CgeB